MVRIFSDDGDGGFSGHGAVRVHDDEFCADRRRCAGLSHQVRRHIRRRAAGPCPIDQQRSRSAIFARLCPSPVPSGADGRFEFPGFRCAVASGYKAGADVTVTLKPVAGGKVVQTASSMKMPPPAMRRALHASLPLQLRRVFAGTSTFPRSAGVSGFCQCRSARQWRDEETGSFEADRGQAGGRRCRCGQDRSCAVE